mmetsp:Transcript_24020/g.55243  ORF Transcript_24020/g.55243 Transcript_24020/m.55243 type:complete len:513 (+) Transcript_24020:164-1702(+)
MAPRNGARAVWAVLLLCRAHAGSHAHEDHIERGGLRLRGASANSADVETPHAFSNETVGSGSGCIAEWQTCSVDDDNAISCCDGLTCVVKSDYYAQCKSSGPSPVNNPTHRPSPMPYPAPTKVPSPSPTKAPTKGGSTPSPTPKSGPTPSPGYACGNPLTGKDSEVATWYATWAAKYIVDLGSGKCVQRIGQGNDCVSEGTGYGMLMAAWMDDQTNFDGLWAFAQEHFDSNGLMNWQISSGNQVVGSGSASDGDIDMALGLVKAAEVWGGSYLADATTLINNIMAHEIDSSTHTVLPGDSWDVSSPPYNPSYFAPGHFRIFEEVTGDSLWADAITQGYSLNSDCANYNSGTGLVPDWSESLTSCNPGSNWVSWTLANGADYYYDAVRTPWRLAIDYVWSCESKAKSAVKKMATFFADQGPSAMGQGFTISGSSLGYSTSTCFVGTASTAIVASPLSSSSTRSDWWDYLEGMDQENSYFCDTLQMIMYIFDSGNFEMPSVSTARAMANNAPVA